MLNFIFERGYEDYRIAIIENSSQNRFFIEELPTRGTWKNIEYVRPGARSIMWFDELHSVCSWEEET